MGYLYNKPQGLGRISQSLKDRFQIKMYQQPGAEVGERGQVALGPGKDAAKNAEALAKIKAAWPRCGDAHKYLYTFKNGRTICTQGWRNEFYVDQMMGRIPHESFFDPVKRKEAGMNPNAVIQDSGPPAGPKAPGLLSHPWMLPGVAVLGGLTIFILAQRSR